MRVHQVNVKLTRAELQVLRKMPGESDASRLRALLHTQGLSQALSQQLAATIAADGDETRHLIIELSKRLQQWVDTQTNTTEEIPQ